MVYLIALKGLAGQAVKTDHKEGSGENIWFNK